MTIPVLFLMGPTASGKTAAACALARRFPVEIINVDAAQVYRGLDIGTAKIGPSERAAYPHHLIDIRDPDETYSAALFRGDALRLIAEARARGRLPVLVGGTMFYFHALVHGLPELPSADPRIRAEIESRAAAEGWPALHRTLAEIDPDRARALSPNDGQRIQRALEINALTGGNVGPAPPGQSSPPWPLIKLALAPAARENLHRRIEERFGRMVDKGLIQEVSGLLERYGGSVEPPALKMVGYRQVCDYLKGKTSYNRMMEASIAATRRLAKRQLTWLRNQSAVTWVDSDHPRAVEGICRYLESSPRLVEVSRPGFFQAC